MRCLKCGTEIPEESLYCPNCGSPVQIVPDYSSLEGLLADEVNDVLDENPSMNPYQENNTYHGQRSYDEHRNTSYGSSYDREREIRRKRAEEKKKKKKKTIITIVIILAVLILAGVMAFLYFHNNSYSAQMKAADKAYAAGDFEKALTCYNDAAGLRTDKGEPYVGMGRVFLAMGDPDQAVIAFKKAISIDPKCAEAYLELARYYESIGDLDSITSLFKDVTDSNVLKICSEYVVKAPVITPESGAYTDEVTFTITAESGTVHYTINGGDAALDSAQYTEAIILNENGSYSIRAAAFNEKGIASPQAVAEYQIDIPSPDGPVVTPDAGTYNEPTKIIVQVPEDSIVYYTMDGSEPNENSEVYSEPIDMPEGKTTFSCIAVNSKGKVSSTIKRQYNLLSLY